MNYNKRLSYCKNNETQIGIYTGNGMTQEKLLIWIRQALLILLKTAIFVKSEMKIGMKSICE